MSIVQGRQTFLIHALKLFYQRLKIDSKHSILGLTHRMEVNKQSIIKQLNKNCLI